MRTQTTLSNGVVVTVSDEPVEKTDYPKSVDEIAELKKRIEVLENAK
jgi:hypothetical protein